MKEFASMKFTGERFVPELSGAIQAEHLHRYVVARGIANGLEVLDLACGEGYGSSLLSEVACSVTGIDISIDAICHATEKYKSPNLRFLQGECSSIPLESDSIDLVVSFETIEHHDQHEAMLGEIRRVLRPDGFLIISSPNRPEYNKTLSEPNEFHVKELDFDEFSNLLKKYFTHKKFYAQRVLRGSILSALSDVDSGFMDYWGSATFEQSERLTKPIYFLALAGFGDLPTLGNSVYECPCPPITNIPLILYNARLYFTERVGDIDQFCGEERASFHAYELDNHPKSIELGLPSDLRLLHSLRLDLANAPLVIELHALSLHLSNGDLVWCWDGKCDSFLNSFGVIFLKASDGVTLLCVDGDPRFDLDIPLDILEKVDPGGGLRVSFTPKPLEHEFPYVVSKLLRRELLSPLPSGFGSLHVDKSSVSDSTTIQVPEFSKHLESVYLLLEKSLQYKDHLLERQKLELFRIREELLRAEAQLDLLKDVMLGGREQDRL